MIHSIYKFYSRNWSALVIVLLLIFFAKPLHRVIYLSEIFRDKPVENYKNDILLKTIRYRKETKFVLPVIKTYKTKFSEKKQLSGDVLSIKILPLFIPYLTPSVPQVYCYIGGSVKYYIFHCCLKLSCNI